MSQSAADRLALDERLIGHQESGVGRLGLILALMTVAGLTFGMTLLLVSIFERKVDARTPWLRVVEVTEISTDPEPWGRNWPHHFDMYKKSAGDRYYGGSSAMPESKLESQPWLRRLYAGYTFSLDYREARGHAYMLYDQEVTGRVIERPQGGACLHCHASILPTWRRVGREHLGRPTDDQSLAAEFDAEAVQKGFELTSRLSYEEVHAMMLATPDGTPGENTPLFPGGSGPVNNERAAKLAAAGHGGFGEAHPVSCLDCHDPSSMVLRVTRPGFLQGIRDLAASEADVPHLPSIAAWRRGDRKTAYDPNEHASRQEMRSFTCAQCHVEYYCATKKTLEFPWSQGLKAEDEEAHWERTRFEDGTPFHDYVHGETGAPVFKVQHPEFELWSQGIHARAGVSCADCHMPYERVGAMKLSNHKVQSPMENLQRACQTCHKVSEDELISRVEAIQSRTKELTERAAVAMTAMLDAIREAKAAVVLEADLLRLYSLQRKAMWRLDYISSENSKGFHADQEAARILAESIDFSRQAEALANRLRAPKPPEVTLPTKPIEGVTHKAR